MIGKGPLPPSATSKLRDPDIDYTMERYFWDISGRRHKKEVDDLDSDFKSVVEKALNAIKAAAKNASMYKLDLKKVFNDFDINGDGFLDPKEMAEVFLSLGVEIDIEAMDALFHHFDPDGSGRVHYGEFMWAFFNRRKLTRQYKRQKDKMTETELRHYFHLADTNGNGRLSPHEFQKLLNMIGIKMSDQEIELLISRFDADDDGDIDLDEFKNFIDAEVNELENSINGKQSFSTTLMSELPKPRGKPYHGLRKFMTQKAEKVEDERSKIHATYPESKKIHTTENNDICDTDIYKKLEKSLEKSTSHENRDQVDVLWMTRMLQAQAKVENRLGKKYYALGEGA